MEGGAFSSWKYSHYFEFMSAKDEKNINVRCTLCAGKKILSSGKNTTSTTLRKDWLYFIKTISERSGQSSFLKRLAAVCPWLLCALLLTPAVVLGVLYTGCVEEARANSSTLNKEKYQLQRDYNSLITQNNQLQRDLDAVVVKSPLLDQYCPLRSQKRVCTLCPEGWELRNSTCYYFSTEVKNWNASRSDCLKQGADLVIIESGEEKDFISKHTRGNYAYWIGLSDSETEGTWLWVDGTLLQDDKAFWMSGEPNEYYGSEDCAVTLPGLNKWADVPCYAPARSVCKTDALLL